MAVQLFLDGKEAVIDSSKEIKITKENPYFTQSDSYTLDVVLPSDILANRILFKNIQRIDRSKTADKMSCRLVVNNKVLLNGAAKVTEVTEKQVKVQLLGGNSEINFLSEDSHIYIDEMPLGTAEAIGGYTIINGVKYGGDGTKIIYAVDTGIKFVPKTVYDETLGFAHQAFHYNFVDMLKLIIQQLGYTLEECSFDKEPWNRLFVATANYTFEVAHTLPHWTPKVFFSEISKFFNVTFIYDQLKKTLRIVHNQQFFSDAERIEITPADGYTAGLNEKSEGNAIAADNIKYDMSGSEYHDYDTIPDNVRDNVDTAVFQTKQAAVAAYYDADDDAKKEKVYSYPTGKFTGWIHEYLDNEEIKERLELTDIDMFAPLIRDKEGGEESELKICPVAIGKWVEDNTFTTPGGVTHKSFYSYRLPSIECPAGSDKKVRRGLNPAEGGDDKATVQEYIMGEADIEKATKEERLQVMFVSGVSDAPDGWKITWAEAASMTEFTDFNLKKPDGNVSLPSWSLSLNPSEAAHYLGQLHETGFTFNMKAKNCVKFLADKLPNPASVFIIHGKQFGCEKIEASIKDGQLEKLMTGYFYEMQ